MDIPVGDEITIFFPSGVKGFKLKYKLSLPGSSESWMTRCPVSGSIHSLGEFSCANTRALKVSSNTAKIAGNQFHLGSLFIGVVNSLTVRSKLSQTVPNSL